MATPWAMRAAARGDAGPASGSGAESASGPRRWPSWARLCSNDWPRESPRFAG